MGTEIILRQEGRYRISHNPNYQENSGNGFLEFLRSGQSSYSAVGVYEQHYRTKKWEVSINTPYDQETDTDSILINTFDTKEEAVTALWEIRHIAYKGETPSR